MLALSVFAILFLLALTGVPLIYSLLGATIGIIYLMHFTHPLETIFLSFISGVEPFILIAVPLFIFAGELLSHGGVGKRIVNFARVLFGFLPGGMGIVTVASSAMFGGVSGSAIADTAAIGSLVTPAMVQRGYSRAFTAALLSVSGTLALLMPLSIPFLVYAFISGVSMRQLSMSGLVPAFISAVSLAFVCVWYGKKTGCDNGSGRSTWAEVVAVTKDGAPALLMPFIIVGGIWTGLFTPTEAASVAVMYGLAISLFLYKDITWRDLPALMLKAFETSAVVMLVIGAAGALAWLLTAEQVSFQLAEWVKSVAHDPWVFLLLMNIALFLLGCLLEPLPAMLLITPIFLPIAKAFGIDPVHLGVVMTANLAIGLHTPPVGATLFVAAKLANVGVGEISRAMIPFFIANFIVLMLITYIPSMTRTVQWLMQ